MSSVSILSLYCVFVFLMVGLMFAFGDKGITLWTTETTTTEVQKRGRDE